MARFINDLPADTFFSAEHIAQVAATFAPAPVDDTSDDIRKVGNGHLYRFGQLPTGKVAPQVLALARAASKMDKAIFSLKELAYSDATAAELKTRQDQHRICTYYRGTLVRNGILVKVA